MDKKILNNRYEIIRPIGFGGMAEVYLAQDKLLDRSVAIKRLREQFVSDQTLLEQFRREAKSAARLVHPNIINIYDVVSEDDEQYIVMEYVDGVTLKEVLKKGRLPLKTVLEIALQLADGLQHAHSHNIVHCDIKPQNILIDKQMHPKIADFGIAKMVSNQTMVYTSAVMGSVHYISPEQASGAKITASSDVYSLGIVLFEMLTGQVPFEGDTPVAVAIMHTEKQVPPLSQYMDEVPEGLQKILDKALAKKTSERYENAGALLKDLTSLQLKLFGFSGSAYPQKRETTAVEKVEPCTADEMTVIMKPVRSNGLQKEMEEQEETAQQEDMTGKPRKKSFSLNKLMIMVTTLVVAASVLANFVFGGSTNEVEVPNVLKMTVVEAQKILAERNFKIELEERYADKEKPGTVMEQEPEPQSKRKEGSKVVLTISKGAELLEVPDFKAMSMVKLEQQLERAGFTLGKVTKKYDKKANIGTVLAQMPQAGGKAPKGSAIDFVINEGDKAVPELIGKKLQYADKLLRKEGFTVEIRYVRSASMKDVVMATNPNANTKIGEGDKVVLTVSDGSGYVEQAKFVDYIVPGKEGRQRVQIYVIDDKGRSIIYSGYQKAGARIHQELKPAGEATLQIYCDGKLVEEKTL